MPRPGLEGEFLDGTDDKADGDDTGTGCAHHEEKDDLAVLVLAERVVARADGIGVRDEPPCHAKIDQRAEIPARDCACVPRDGVRLRKECGDGDGKHDREALHCANPNDPRRAGYH